MTDIYDGDSLVILTGNGADLVFTGGQPVMDTGLLNRVNLPLLTESGHWSEDLEQVAARRYKGEFLKAAPQPITLQSLIDTARAAENDVKGEEFKQVRATVTNPNSQNLNVDIEYTPPSRDPVKLRLIKNGENWIQQRDNPKNDTLNSGG